MVAANNFSHGDSTPRKRPEMRWVMPRGVVSAQRILAAGLVDSRLTCTVGSYELTLTVRHDVHGSRVQLAGQVTQTGHLHKPVPDLLLGIVEPDSPAPLVNTLTDRFGEFKLAWRSGTALGLQVGYGHDAPCVLVWRQS